jgi:hypothetical protein
MLRAIAVVVAWSVLCYGPIAYLVIRRGWSVAWLAVAFILSACSLWSVD